MSPFVSPEPFLAFHLFNFSFSVSLLFFSFFLPSCLSCFAFFWFLLFLSLFHFLASLHLFRENQQHQKIQLQSCFHQSRVFFVSCLVFSFKSLFRIFVVSWYSVMFFVQHQCFWLKKHKLKNTNFWSKGELQQNGFF